MVWRGYKTIYGREVYWLRELLVLGFFLKTLKIAGAMPNPQITVALQLLSATTVLNFRGHL